MNIELTQAEVKAAVSLYVQNVIGIELANKKLDIAFSATRHEGVIAKLTITPKASLATAEEAKVIPGFSDGTAETETQAAETEQVAVAATETAPETVEASKEVNEAAAEPQPASEETKAAPKTATLFGKPAATVAE